MKLTDRELVQLEAEELGLTLSDSDITNVLEAWRMRPTTTIRLLLTGIRNLNEPERQARLRRMANTLNELL